MQLHTIANDPLHLPADVLVLGMTSDDPQTGPWKQVDEATGGLLSRLRSTEEFTGKRYETVSVHGPRGPVEAKHLIVVGLGERVSIDRGVAHFAAATALKQAGSRKRQSVAMFLADALPDIAEKRGLLEHAIAGSVVGCRGQDLYRHDKKLHEPEEVLWSGVDGELLERGRILGESMSLTRRLVNEPPQVIYPETFALRAEEVAREAGLEVEVWDERRLEAERCGALLAVGRGSTRPPRLVMLRHRGGAADARPLALVGKGVTFDSGGLSIKPSESMLSMKCDMAGAATVLGTMRAIGMLKLPVNVIGLMGLVENMPGPGAMKLGDVLTARNGRTIEVHNTDAEGRLVLADVLSLAVDLGAERLVDLATLTGACMVALGRDVAGLMTNDQAWCDQVAASALRCGELAWQLPMFPEYDELIKSEVADMKNVGDGRWAGAIAAAKLLEQFVGKLPWTHIDIAGPAFNEKPKPWLDGGATGAYVRTLVELVRGQATSA